MKSKNGPLVSWVLFLISEIFAALIYINLSSFDDSQTEKNDTTRNLAFSMIIVNGHGMILYRLLPMCRTLLIKYIHAFIHTLALLGVGYSHTKMGGAFNLDNLDMLLYCFTMGVYVFQYILSIFVYLYLYSDQRRRKSFAAIHNFIGICILQMSIATVCVRVQHINLDQNLTTPSGGYLMMCMVFYGVIINAIVLNPYLEWSLVGPL